MYRDRIGKFQFVQLFERIFCPSAILKFHLGCLGKVIDRPEDSGISIKYTNTFLNWNTIQAPDFPFHLVIIPDLHDFIALAEKSVCIFSFFL